MDNRINTVFFWAYRIAKITSWIPYIILLGTVIFFVLNPTVFVLLAVYGFIPSGMGALISLILSLPARRVAPEGVRAVRSRAIVGLVLAVIHFLIAGRFMSVLMGV